MGPTGDCRLARHIEGMACDVTVWIRDVPRAPSDAHQVADQFGTGLFEGAGGHLHHRARRRVATGEHALLVPVSGPLEDSLSADERRDPLPDDGIAAPPGNFGGGDQLTMPPPAAGAAHVPRPLAAEGALGDTPPLVQLSEDRAAVEPYGLQEHLVEVPAAGDVDQRPNG